MLRSLTCPAGPEQAVHDGLVAITAEPPWSPWRDQALGICGEAYRLMGDLDRARALFAESAGVSAASPTDAFVVSKSELALLAMDRGQWTEAAEHSELALAAIDTHRMHDYATSVLAFAGAALLAVHGGDLQEANRQLTRAMRARPACTFALPGLAVRARLVLAKVHWALANHTTARPASRGYGVKAQPLAALARTSQMRYIRWRVMLGTWPTASSRGRSPSQAPVVTR
jgi:LuxR family maltose regulon positive regulatory protein